jgi:iron complex outermembrane receptor protein
MKDQHVFSKLKLRLGYGVSGNALGFGAYSAVKTYGASGSYFVADGDTYVSLGATKLANPN